MTQEEIDALWAIREKMYEQQRKESKITKRFQKLLEPYIEQCRENGHRMPDGESAFYSPYNGIRCKVCKICGMHIYPQE